MDYARANADLELDARGKTFSSGLLPELIAALRRSRPGDLLAVTSADPGLGDHGVSLIGMGIKDVTEPLELVIL